MSREEKRERDQYRYLDAEERVVIQERGTEPPNSGGYNKFFGEGTYLCKRCGYTLYRSESKFNSGSGWPAFDDHIGSGVKQLPDPDGVREEIVCSVCGAHLGHIFSGEGFTPSDIRHCVNSISLDFVPVCLKEGRYETAIFAGGCFWGVEYYMKKAIGVKAVISGYTGGDHPYPTYQLVCSGTTGHAEAVRVIFDPSEISYGELVRLFLEIHDPEQEGGQGPDIGTQYRSEIFFLNSVQEQTAKEMLSLLGSRGYRPVTLVTAASRFYDAEEYHQDYYNRKGTLPYCHGYTKRF